MGTQIEKLSSGAQRTSHDKTYWNRVLQGPFHSLKFLGSISYESSRVNFCAYAKIYFYFNYLLFDCAF